MKAFHRQTFDVDELKLVAGVYADYEFDRCTFSSVPFVYPRNPEDRAIIRNVRLTNCDVKEPMLGTVVVEDCTIENLKTHDLFMIHGAVFKHVVLRGRFGSLMFTEFLPGGSDDEGDRLRTKALFARADDNYYERVDWALDIRAADFYDCEFRYVPGHLVRRDPETQVLIWRDNLLRHKWDRLVFPVSGYHIGLKVFVKSNRPSLVLVAGKRHPKFKLLLEQLKKLREFGIAEQD